MNLLVIHLLSISMVYLYFYIALYRFAGATAMKAPSSKTRLVKSTTLLSVGTMLSSMQLTGL